MTVVFLGPLPPPVHGFSEINRRMLERLKAGEEDVLVFDRSLANGGASGVLQSLKNLGATFSLFCRFLISVLAERPRSLYVGFSGGVGQLLDLPFLLVAEFLKIRTFLHHHSFAYINRESKMTRFAFLCARQASHIVLGEAMKEGLVGRYGIPSSKVFVLSNAAFVDDEGGLLGPSGVGRALRIGFLSNITREKGIFDFFDILRELEGRHVAYEAFVAGPIDAVIRDEFDNAFKEVANTAYVGPVYGVEKLNFFAGLDILIFPTRYENEAEPVTIIEALRSGLMVLAAERGCIKELVAGVGKCVKIEEFRGVSVESCAELSGDSNLLVKKKLMARMRYKVLHQKNSLSLDRLVRYIIHGDVFQEGRA